MISAIAKNFNLICRECNRLRLAYFHMPKFSFKIVIKYSVFLAVVIFTLACKRKDITTIKGLLLEANTGAIVEGAEVEISYSKLSNGVYSSGYSSLGKAESNSAGEYSIEFENVSAVDYRLRVIREGFFYHEEFINRDEIENGYVNQLDMKLFEEATFNLHFFNQGSAENQLIFRLEPHSEGCSDCCESDTWSFKGIKDTTIVCQVHAHQTIYYDATIIGPNGSSEKDGKIVAEVGENYLEFSFD